VAVPDAPVQRDTEDTGAGAAGSAEEQPPAPETRQRAEGEAAELRLPRESNSEEEGEEGEEEEEEGEEDWEDAWEEEDGEEGEEGALGGGSGSVTAGAGSPAAAALTITLDGQEAARKSRRPGRGGGAGAGGVLKVDRLRARVVHRSHLLCLLGRGLALEAAARDPLLQAQLLSLVQPGPAAKLHEGQAGAGGATPAVSLRGVRQQLSWLRQAFRLLPAGGGAAGPAPDPVLAACLATGGVAAVAAQLRDAVQARRCGGEQLAALFAALLRAQGAAVRLVCALHASPLRPTGKPVVGCPNPQTVNPSRPACAPQASPAPAPPPDPTSPFPLVRLQLQRGSSSAPWSPSPSSLGRALHRTCPARRRPPPHRLRAPPPRRRSCTWRRCRQRRRRWRT
jgi:hypothetical protein